MNKNENNNSESENLTGKVFFISGAAKRIGAAIAADLHASGANIVIHYRHSQKAAKELSEKFNKLRADSACLLQADLGDVKKLQDAVTKAALLFGRLDGLINNASTFYATPLSQATEGDWDALFNSNLKGAYFLSQAALPYLQKTRGCIINITDIFAEQPLPNHNLYCAAKAGLLMMTKSLALELAPDVRVNAISPGAILWPENENNNEMSVEKKLSRVPMQRKGEPEDIVQAIRFLIDATYVTGQVLKVDGGRSLT